MQGSTIRTRLLMLVLAVALPMGLAAAGAVYYVYESTQRQFHGGLREAARALALVVDGEMAKRESIARTLSESPALRRGDLREFYEFARAIAPGDDTAVVLSDLAGQQVVNTRRPFGDPSLPKLVLTRDQLTQGRQQPLLSDLFFAPTGKQYSFALSVPAMRNGAPAFLVSYSGHAAALQRLFDDQRLPQNWTAAILDAQGTIVARNREPERFVGQPAVAQLREAVRAHDEGMLRTTTKTGSVVLAAFSKAPRYGWSLVIGVPEEEVGSPAAAAAWVAGIATFILALSLAFALHLGRRLVRRVEDIRNAAQRIAQGEPVVAGRSGIAELDTVLQVLAASGEAVRNASGELQRRVDAAVAEAEQAQRAVLQNQRLEALGQLTGGVAHDFNNLLMVVSNYVFLMKAKYGEVGGSKELAGIERSVATGAKLTRQLLAFARRQPVLPQPMLLQARLPEVASLIGTSLGSGIELTCSVEPDTAPVMVDMAEFELAVINLAVNARDAMPGGGRLHLAARNAGDAKVEISVSDTGSGIPPELLHKVFEPFYTTKPVGHGTGLGLSQVYGFARQAGGEARIASEPGRGTTVTLLLPATTAAVEQRTDAQVPRADGGQAQVLLVEDNLELGQVTEQVLVAANYRVSRVTDAAQALRQLGESRFDVVLSDVRMPGENDGLWLAEWIVHNRPATPVILTTGYAEHIEQARRLGVPVVPKPVEPEVLIGELERAMKSQPGREAG